MGSLKPESEIPAGHLHSKNVSLMPFSLSVQGHHTGRRRKITRLKTLHANPICHLPQLQIITKIKEREGGGGLRVCWIALLSLRGKLKQRHCSKLRECVNYGDWWNSAAGRTSIAKYHSITHRRNTPSILTEVQIRDRWRLKMLFIWCLFEEWSWINEFIKEF